MKNSCHSCLTFFKRVSIFSVFAHFQKDTEYLRTGTGPHNIYVDENGAVNALSILESVTNS